MECCKFSFCSCFNPKKRQICSVLKVDMTIIWQDKWPTFWMQVMYSHWGVWSFARILHVVHRTCSQWWRKVAAKLFRSIFGLRTLNQRVFQPLNKRRDQRSNSAVGRFFPSFLVPSPRQTKQSKISRKFSWNAFWFAPFDR